MVSANVRVPVQRIFFNALAVMLCLVIKSKPKNRYASSK